MSKRKEVKRSKTYKFGPTEELEVKTRDGWFYVFQRPSKHAPFRFKERRRPDGSLVKRKVRLPENVVEFVDKAFDGAELQPQFKRSTRKWSQQ